MSVPINWKDHTFTYEAGGTITQYACCVTNAEGTCVVGAGSNDTGFCGVSIEAAASGQAVNLAGVGAIVPVQVGATGVTVGTDVIIADASGRIGPVGVASGTAYNVVGRALEAGTTIGDVVSMIVLSYVKEP